MITACFGGANEIMTDRFHALCYVTNSTQRHLMLVTSQIGRDVFQVSSYDYMRASQWCF